MHRHQSILETPQLKCKLLKSDFVMIVIATWTKFDNEWSREGPKFKASRPSVSAILIKHCQNPDQLYHPNNHPPTPIVRLPTEMSHVTYNMRHNLEILNGNDMNSKKWPWKLSAHLIQFSERARFLESDTCESLGRNLIRVSPRTVWLSKPIVFF